jgi:integrase
MYPGGNLYRSVWVGNREDKRSLGHKDRKRALAQAHELVVHLKSAEAPLEQNTVTMGALLVRYLASEAHGAKGERTRKEDEQKLRRVVGFVGATRRAVSLGAEDVLRFTRARKEGFSGLLAVVPGRKVGDRAVEADLVALRTMLNWGRGAKNADGIPLLSANPLFGVPFPKELNPRRPVATEDDFLRLLAVARAVDPRLEAGLVIAEGTGRRLSAWRRLRWGNVRFDNPPFGAIRWPDETDKGGVRQLRPISEQVRDALLGVLASIPTPPADDDWVFPSPADPAKPCSPGLLDDWLREAYRLADLDSEPGGLWHPFRRKWVTERKGYPRADIAAAGGWRDERSLDSYLRDDPDTTRRVVLEPTHRLRRDAGL